MQQYQNCKCMQDNPAQTVCHLAVCPAEAVLLCAQTECPCHTSHIQCAMPLESLRHVVQGRIINAQRGVQMAMKPVMEELANLSKDIEKTKEILLDLFVGEEEILVHNAFKSSDWSQINSTMISAIYSKVPVPQNDTAKKLREAVRDLSGKLSQIRKLNQDMATSFVKEPVCEKRMKEQQSVISVGKRQIASKLLQKGDEDLLLNMFKQGGISPKSFQLLFRASSHQFKVKAFHKTCDGKQNTLTLCKTEFRKVFGGFTPCAWENPDSGVYKRDETEKSFVFSLSGNVRLPCINSYKAIYCHSGYGPAFGEGHDFVICDQADTGQKSHAGVIKTYDDEATKSGQQAAKLFGGQVNGYKFKVLQWEIWKVQL